jgi:predicted SAM-dependent methyltransferase
MPNYLNLGCGNIYHKDWINIDYTSNSSFVKEHNILSGIPFDNDTIDFVYHSHILEHLSKKQGEKFILECYRVLKKEGVIRVVIPDLRTITSEYLNAIEKYNNNPNKETEENYRWSVIELIDQMVRDESGGEMLKYWCNGNITNYATLEKRTGLKKSDLNKFSLSNNQYKLSPKDRVIRFILKLIGISWIEFEMLKFYKIGERHKWMYDSISISILLSQSGFRNITIQSGKTSYVKDWEKYSSLDVSSENRLRKPDSLIIEAIK